MSEDSPSAPVETLGVTLKFPDVDTFAARFGGFLERQRILLPGVAPRPQGTQVRFHLKLKDNTPLIAGLGRVEQVVLAGAIAGCPPGTVLTYEPDAASLPLCDRILAGRGDGPSPMLPPPLPPAERPVAARAPTPAPVAPAAPTPPVAAEAPAAPPVAAEPASAPPVAAEPASAPPAPAAPPPPSAPALAAPASPEKPAPAEKTPAPAARPTLLGGLAGAAKPGARPSLLPPSPLSRPASASPFAKTPLGMPRPALAGLPLPGRPATPGNATTPKPLLGGRPLGGGLLGNKPLPGLPTLGAKPATPRPAPPAVTEPTSAPAVAESPTPDAPAAEGPPAFPAVAEAATPTPAPAAEPDAPSPVATDAATADDDGAPPPGSALGRLGSLPPLSRPAPSRNPTPLFGNRIIAHPVTEEKAAVSDGTPVPASEAVTARSDSGPTSALPSTATMIGHRPVPPHRPEPPRIPSPASGTRTSGEGSSPSALPVREKSRPDIALTDGAPLFLSEADEASPFIAPEAEPGTDAAEPSLFAAALLASSQSGPISSAPPDWDSPLTSLSPGSDPARPGRATPATGIRTLTPVALAAIPPPPPPPGLLLDADSPFAAPSNTPLPQALPEPPVVPALPALPVVPVLIEELAPEATQVKPITLGAAGPSRQPTDLVDSGPTRISPILTARTPPSVAAVGATASESRPAPSGPTPGRIALVTAAVLAIAAFAGIALGTLLP